MKLSIVVPVYNVQDYVCKCLQSIVDGVYGQDCCEVIVIDDGSTDSSYDCVENFDWHGINHVVISQENSGLSAARNAGLDKASGQYVWFVDSDDWLEPSIIPAVLDNLDGEDILAFSSYRRVFQDNVVIDKKDYRPSCGREFSSASFFHGAPFYIFRRLFLVDNGLRFTEGIYFEDSLFTPIALYKAGSVNVFDVPVYNNLQRSGSITHSDFSKRKSESFQTVIEGLNTFMNEQMDVEDRHEWATNVADIINSYAFSACSSHNHFLADIAREFIDKKKNVAALKYSSSLLTRIWYYLGVLFGGRYFEVYELLYKIRY